MLLAFSLHLDIAVINRVAIIIAQNFTQLRSIFRTMKFRLLRKALYFYILAEKAEIDEWIKLVNYFDVQNMCDLTVRVESYIGLIVPEVSFS